MYLHEQAWRPAFVLCSIAICFGLWPLSSPELGLKDIRTNEIQWIHILGTLGHLGSWALGHLGSWAFGLLDPWLLDLWALGPLDSWALGLLGPWALGPLGFWALGLLGP
jgi:hypothetical protein